jgi:dephospho-CoA kinase
MTSDKRLVIGLVGRKGSGKGTVARLLKDRYGASIYRFSDLLRDILDGLYIEKSRENLVRLSEVLRKEFGQRIFKDAMAKQVEHDTASIIVIDGIRRLDDLEGLETLGDFTLVNINASLDLRYQRILKRGENAGEMAGTFEDFKDMETLPTEASIADVEVKADETIENLDSYDDLAYQVDALMKSIKHEQT